MTPDLLSYQILDPNLHVSLPSTESYSFYSQAQPITPALISYAALDQLLFLAVVFCLICLAGSHDE